MYDPNKVLSVNETPSSKSYTLTPRLTRPLPYYDVNKLKALFPIMKLNGLINDSSEVQAFHLVRLIIIFDNLQRGDKFNLPVLLPRLQWNDIDPFQLELPIYIPDWTGEHDRYIFLQYIIYIETETDYSFASINIKIDTTLDPNFGELGYHWTSVILPDLPFFNNASRYKNIYFIWFQQDILNDSTNMVFSTKDSGYDIILQSASSLKRIQAQFEISCGRGTITLPGEFCFIQNNFSKDKYKI